MTMATRPTHAARTEVWVVTILTGRKVWARPHNSPTTTNRQWCLLTDAWVENLEHTIDVVGIIQWEDHPHEVRWNISQHVHLELTAEEMEHTTLSMVGGPTSYDWMPWGSDLPDTDAKIFTTRQTTPSYQATNNSEIPKCSPTTSSTRTTQTTAPTPDQFELFPLKTP